jgi:archaellum component FlaC
LSNTAAEAKKVNDEMNMMREAITRLESRFTDTPEGRAAKYIAFYAENIKKHGNPYVARIFGQNMNDDRLFMSGLIRYSGDAGSLRVFKDVKRRLNKCKVDVGELKGVIDGNKFARNFAEPLIKDYERQKKQSVKVLKEALHKEANAGAEAVQEARYVDDNVHEIHERVNENERITEAVNRDITIIKNLLQQADIAGGRRLSPEQLAAVIRNHGEIELKEKNEEDVARKSKTVIAGFNTYIKKSDECAYIISIPVFRALHNAYGDKIEQIVEGAEEKAAQAEGVR